MKKTGTFAAAAVAVALVASACSSQTVGTPEMPTIQAETATTEKGGVRRQAVTIHAKVQKIDHKARKVTLVGYDGTTETLTVGPEAKNLDQVKKGDDVVVSYYQAIAFDVLPKGAKAEPATVAAGVATAEQGDMPGGLAAEVTTLTVTVVKLDREKSTAVIRGTEGNTATVDIQNPAVFDKVKVGDKVEIRLTEAVAIDVQRPASK